MLFTANKPLYPIQEVHVCVSNGVLLIREYWRRCAEFSAEMDLYEYGNPNASERAGTIVKRYWDARVLWNYLDHLNKSDVLVRFMPENSFHYIEKEDIAENYSLTQVNPIMVSWFIAIMVAVALFIWHQSTK